MRSWLFSTIVALSVVACAKTDKPEPATEPAGRPSEQVATITIDELDAKLGRGECQAVDANGEGTRKKMGVIPGAVLLSDYDTFSTSELPADKSKTLVFYCANTYCDASHEAAARAMVAGYTNVKVLPDGIAGWVKAGKQVQKI